MHPVVVLGALRNAVQGREGSGASLLLRKEVLQQRQVTQIALQAANTAHGSGSAAIRRRKASDAWCLRAPFMVPLAVGR